MSKIKNGGLDQYGAKRFEQQQFGAAGVEGVKGLDICYSTAYMSQTQEQEHITISEVAADRHKLIIPQHIMRPYTACTTGQLDPRCS